MTGVGTVVVDVFVVYVVSVVVVIVFFGEVGVAVVVDVLM